MATAENAKIQYESGQNLIAMVALTDKGDHKDYRSASYLWSNRAGYQPTVHPNGLATGGAVSPAASSTNDMIDIAALTCYLAGILTTVGLTSDETITRPTSTHNKSSVTITSAGIVDIVTGTDGTSHSDVRGAAGGPPFIPTTSIEIAQVWLSSATPADIMADEIKQVVGVHCERYDYPTWEEKRTVVTNGIIEFAGIQFAAALPVSHTGSVTKKVYAQYYEPIFTDISKTADFVPPGNTYSVSSTQIYGGTIGAKTSSLNQGTFMAYLNDGISDGILALEGQSLFFKFFQNRLNTYPYTITQGTFGFTNAYPAAAQITASCTISAETAALRVTG